MLITSPEDFGYIEIGLSSPDKIRYWSHGEVEKPETINYRTFKPERKGLFCEKIFGPVKDWECSCGKYRRVRYRGIVCERCGVQVTHSKVRRERMGHIELAAPVSHIWFLKGIPSYMGLLLDMTSRELEEVIYYDSYIVTKVHADITDIKYKQILGTDEYYDAKEEHGDKIVAEMGASAIQTLLSNMNLEEAVKELREEIKDAKSHKLLRLTKRLKIVESLQSSGNRPEWMVLEAIPIMPPDLRPMVQLEGGRFATSDLNDLYRRVVNRNNRLKRLIDIGAPEMIVRNEKRMLQEAVDMLIANGKRGRAVTGSNGRPLKSLGNIIEGKQGRFRQNLLGKRVDYSGRSVIVVGPHLKFHQCGLPKEMALELFKPFVIRKLVEEGYVTNVKSAKRKIEQKDVYVWDVLEEIIKGQPVLLNRAPTLHRLGIQAFDPVLVEGSAIQVHPLVCTAFNADFDGDQMAVHVPLSLEAQSECRLLIMSNNNVLSPSNGRSIITPTQDMVLGIYFLTVDDPSVEIGRNKYYGSYNEAFRAYQAKAIKIHSQIRIRFDSGWIETTIGRAIFNNAIWTVFDEFSLEREGYINTTIGKKQLADLILKWYNKYDNEITSILADRLKNTGFHYATISGISISIDDLKIPKNKIDLIERAEKDIDQLDAQHKKGAMNEEEKTLRSHDIWRRVTGQISGLMEDEFGGLNNIFIMANSGARGNIDQVRQLAGMRGLMSDAQGRTVKVPIKSNFKEGLSLAEYFISCYGARKGLVDTALRTADSGYLTRRLVDVAQDVTIVEADCGVKEGIVLQAIRDEAQEIVTLGELVEGRISLETVEDPAITEPLVKPGEVIKIEKAERIDELGLKALKVRSIYTCRSERGVCQQCYGLDLATGRIINIGEAVGIIAAQSIGEPGTQLTMRTFHTGGVDLRKASLITIPAKVDGTVDLGAGLNVTKIRDEDGNDAWVAINEGTIYLNAKNEGKYSVYVPQYSQLYVKDKAKVKSGDTILSYDPSYKFIVAQNSGKVQFVGFSAQVDKDSKGKVTGVFAAGPGELFVETGKTETVTVTKDHKDQFQKGKRAHTGMSLNSKESLSVSGIVTKVETSSKPAKKDPLFDVTISLGDAYPVYAGSILHVEDGDKVKEKDVLAMDRISSEEASKTKDIVQGLPRVEELFEARRYRDNAILSEIEGMADVFTTGSQKIVAVVGESDRKEYKVSDAARVTVFSGQQIKRGDQLTSGMVNPHDLLETKGVQETQKYLVEEVQRVYRSQGVSINSKHVEVIVRQMTRKVLVETMGGTELLPNDMVDVRRFEAANAKAKAAGNEEATGSRALLGITRASLSTESFISASSFQETAKVLSRAAINGEKDEMYGLKENVIIGKLIPAGTGFKHYNNISLRSTTGESLEVTEEELAFMDQEKSAETASA